MRVLALSLLASLVVVVSAHAARPARPAERAAIVAVTKTYIEASGCCTIITRIEVHRVRVSTVNGRWAVIDLNGYDGRRRLVGPASAVLYKGNLTGRWRVRAFGSDDLGCPMPPAVRRDLGQRCYAG